MENDNLDPLARPSLPARPFTTQPLQVIDASQDMTTDVKDVNSATSEVENNDAQEPRKRAANGYVPKTLAKWEQEDLDRIKEAIKKYAKPLEMLKARDAAESDTRILITDVLCDAFGLDKYSDLRTEQLIAKEFADYVIQIDGKQHAIVEAKRVGLVLKDTHFKQAKQYAVNEGIEWIILTNGQVWQVYCLTAGLPVVHEKILEFDILSQEHSIDEKAERMALITKESLKRGRLDEYRKKVNARSPKVLLEALFTEDVINLIKKEVRRDTGIVLTPEEIVKTLRKQIIRDDLLD